MLKYKYSHSQKVYILLFKRFCNWSPFLKKNLFVYELRKVFASMIGLVRDLASRKKKSCSQAVATGLLSNKKWGKEKGESEYGIGMSMSQTFMDSLLLAMLS